MTAVQVLVICTGNICRSPMGEVVLRERLERAGLRDAAMVDSAGISAEEFGNPIDSRARRVLSANGYDVPRRQAQQVTAQQLASSDLVLAMTAQHAASLRRLIERSGLTGDEVPEVVMYRAFDPDAPKVRDGRESVLDVDDPWYYDEAAFVDCLEQIEAGADGVVEWVRNALAN